MEQAAGDNASSVGLRDRQGIQAGATLGSMGSIDEISATSTGMPGGLRMAAAPQTGGLQTSAASTQPSRKPGGHAGFRSSNVSFLQQQNKDLTRVLDETEQERDEAFASLAKWEEKRQEIQREYARYQQQLADLDDKCNVSAADIHKRDEQTRLLADHNRSILDMLEQEEKTCKEQEVQVNELTTNRDKLQAISDQYDNIKETGNEQLASAYTEIAKFEEELRNAISETEQLREAEQNFQAQAKVDLEAFEKRYKEAKEKNVEHLQQIQHNEVHEHRLMEGLKRLKETLDELTVQKKGIKMQMDVDVDQRDKWTQSKAEVERRKEMLEKTVEALRQSLRSAEEDNARMQDENKAGADNFRQLGDKAYALIDQLRQHQTDLKKAEQSGTEKEKKIGSLTKQGQGLQSTLQMEVDAKLNAEAEARSAAQMQALLLKKNRALEDAQQKATETQAKVEKRLHELTEKAHAFETQNDYLGSRIDGNEDDKGALKYDLRRVEDEMRQATALNAQLTQRHTEMEDDFNDLGAKKAALKVELDYIKREDMLDDSGRTKPLLIESESKIIERLQINEFLYSAQQQRNPIPMLVEKISHLLEMIHTAQTQSDLFLQDLQRSNSMLTALRQKNMSLYEKVQLCETWKMRALLKIASNEFELRENVKGHKKVKDQTHSLYLDGLQYSNKELAELKKLICNYMKQEYVKEITLQDNQLGKSSVGPICDLIDLCPYLTHLDLKKNKLDDASMNDIEGFVQRIPGITTVTRDPASGDIRAKSGNQIRLVVSLEDQSPPDPDSKEPTADDLFAEDPSGQIADNFLATGAGVTTQTRLQGPDAPGGGAARTLLPPQRGGLGGSRSETTLPRIPSATQLSPTKGRR